MCKTLFLFSGVDRVLWTNTKGEELQEVGVGVLEWWMEIHMSVGARNDLNRINKGLW